MLKNTTKGYFRKKINGIEVNCLLEANSSNYDTRGKRNIKYIVMHYTGNSKDTAKANANYFTGANREASAHFFVDDTSIYQSVKLKDVAWHCGTTQGYYHFECRNNNSIGIEMCCTAGNYKISDKTIKNAAYLCAALCKELNISASNVDNYVLRHYDVTHKKCPAQMVSSSSEWKAFKDQVKAILEPKKETFKSYLVTITATALNVRAGAGTNYKINTTVKKNEVYTIVEEKTVGTTTWGKLKSGAGWISLKYT
ncbi:MAG: N-acetylmuramoyl-L-alanine amidase, partial [Romboutsia timonensis]